jgi:hypothetical protein
MHHTATHWKTGYMPLIIGGIGLMASALLMPWVTVASPVAGAFARTGIQLHEGRLFALGLIALALVARREAVTPKPATRLVLLVGFLVLGVAVAVEYRDLIHLVAAFNADFAQARVGFGIFAMGLGLAFSLAGVLKRRIALQLQPSQEDAEQFAA